MRELCISNALFSLDVYLWAFVPMLFLGNRTTCKFCNVGVCYLSSTEVQGKSPKLENLLFYLKPCGRKTRTKATKHCINSGSFWYVSKWKMETTQNNNFQMNQFKIP